MLLFPVYIKPEVTEATSKTATPSTLTFASTRSSATVHLDSINAVSGSFATSTVEQTASFSISTNNATGYTLTLKTTGNDTALTDDTNSNTSTNHLNTISSSTTADDFTVNTWGLIPSKYNGSANTTTYYPASSTGFTIDETTTANTTANNYTVGIGIKVNYDTRSATYTNDTLIAEYVANPVTYSITYYSNTEDTVTDMPQTNPQTGTVSSPANPSPSQDITTSLASSPSRDGYTFLGWCAGNSAGTADTTNNTSITNITTTDDVDTCSSTVYDADQSFGINATGSSPDAYYLYAMWAPEAPDLPCEAGYICYRGNGATAGTMPDQEVTTSSVMLTSSNFSRPGYGFAGWNTSSDGTGTSYGPAETITPGDLSSEGLKLYARWLAPSGVLQTWAGASNMSVGDVVALRDNRDNEVYAVAKLADNNVWITENLRLVPNTANITDKNTHNPTSTFLSAVPSSSSSTTQCSTDDSTCNDHVYFYTGNMDRTKTQSPINNDYNYAWYSYGTMYNWYTATAGNGTNSKNSGSVSGDICPSGWHLPTGGSSGEYTALASALGGNSSTGATNIRKYPNNFIWSGDYNPSTQIPDGRGVQARLWSATAQSAAKSYRMGFNSSSITPAGTWNKWDNFAVRCIYQGGNLPYSAVTVDFEGTGINSLTFTNPSYDTETATPASPTISIVEGAEYTVTANLTTGYEVSSWSTTTNGTLGDTTTTNPAANPNTYTITGDATLTVTGQITPIYDVNVTLGEHVTGISFSHPTYGTINITPQNSTDNGDGTYTNTATLYRGVEYTLASSYEDGYTLHEWVAGANSTIGSTTSAATTYSVTGNTTLSLTAKETDELTYNLVYSAGQGTDAPDQVTETSYQNTQNFTITNSAPIYYGYTFTGWSETADANNNGTTVDYTSGDTITVATTGVTTTKTLYPVYQAVSTCPSSRICYYENGADVIGGGRGTMANQSASSNSSAKLIPTNYSKAGYGFAGWTTSENATPYGPNATITTPDLSSTGLALYAKWVKSTGTLQTWNSCNSLDTNGITALTDTRDNNTYAVAKLADNNCWIVENLRLVPSTANITSQNTHNPASGFATEAASSSSSDALCTTDDSSTCINQLQYNTNSLNRSLTQSYNAVSNSAGWYSYGVYYNWYTATAGNGTMETEANTNATGDICPSKWHLPTSTSSGEWAALNTAVNGGVSNADAGLRQYPVNLIWSGDYNGSSRTSGYGNGRYWAATGYDTNNAYRMGHQESGSKGSTPSGYFKKWDGFAVRCIYDGDIANPHSVTVTLPTGVESITFTNSTGTQTATPQDNTVSLAENAAYTITANMTTGYELVSWTGGSNSTIGDSSANPTTIRITDDTTLTLTAQTIPTYTVTVSLDSNTTSIVFTSTGYPAQSVTTNGDTVTLRRGVSYTITASFATSYELGSWSNGTNSTIGSTTTNPTTFTVTGASTLSVTSQQQEIAPPNCASSPAISTIAPGITYMQDINSSNYNTILSNMSTTTSYKIKDSRDDQNYCIAKLADGKIWMTSNLNLAGGTALSASDTDVDASYISSFTTSNRLTKTGNTIVLPASSTSGFDSYNDAYVYNSNSTTCGSGSPCYSYYSWAATTLGSGKSITTDNTDAPYSICPKGWRLPKTGAVQNKDYKRGDFYALATVYGANLDLNYYDEYSPTFNEFYNNAGPGTIPNFLLAGSYNYGSFMFDASPGGDYWSATSDSSEYYARGYFIQSTNVQSTGSSNRYFGYSVRCIATQPTSSVTVSMDSGVSSVTFSDGTTTQTATSANPTVTLTDGVSYTITASFATGYELASWSTTTGGTLTSTTTNPTTYTVTGATTLSVTSQEIIPPNCASSPTISTIAPGVTYMQDINSGNYNTILSNMSTTISYKIKDSRDNQNYCVAKLADGKLWMTSNLNIAGGTALSATDTDVDASYISSFSTSNNLTKTGSTIVLPTSSTSGFDVNNYSYVYNTGNNTDTCTSATGGCYSYYSWDAATLGSGRSIATDNTNAPYSICPKGWHLPTTYNGSGTAAEATDFRALMIAFGGSNSVQTYKSSTSPTGATMSTTLQSSPNNFLLAGLYVSGSFDGGGSSGLYWSAMSSSSSGGARYLSFYSAGVGSAYYNGRYYGLSVRCVFSS